MQNRPFFLIRFGNADWARLAGFSLLAGFALMFCGCQTTPTCCVGAGKTFALKLAAPQADSHNLSSAKPGPFEQQFRLDTGETNATRRAEFDQPLRIKGQSKTSLVLKFDLSSWPENLRPLARVWVAVGATNTFTTEVNVSLNFSQNGTGVSVPLNNRISIGNMALMGCDFLVNDGEVMVGMENAGQPRAVDFTLHAIIYVPHKIDPDCVPAKP
jgi:hypothetical protein